MTALPTGFGQAFAKIAHQGLLITALALGPVTHFLQPLDIPLFAHAKLFFHSGGQRLWFLGALQHPVSLAHPGHTQLNHSLLFQIAQRLEDTKPVNLQLCGSINGLQGYPDAPLFPGRENPLQEIRPVVIELTDHVILGRPESQLVLRIKWRRGANHPFQLQIGQQCIDHQRTNIELPGQFMH